MPELKRYFYKKFVGFPPYQTNPWHLIQLNFTTPIIILFINKNQIFIILSCLISNWSPLNLIIYVEQPLTADWFIFKPSGATKWW